MHRIIAVIAPFLLTVALTVAAARASTYVVLPDGTGDFATIQAAIDAAVAGDVIELGDGVFRGDGNRDLVFMGKAITVRAQSGDPELAIIDCEGTALEPHNGVNYVNAEGANSILENITITGGVGPGGASLVFGGAIHCNAASPTIRNCRLIGNQAAAGGAIQCADGASPTVTGCLIIDNQAVPSPSTGGGVGGAIFVSGGSPMITGCTFLRNRAGEDFVGSGGALQLEASFATVSDCAFTNNETVGDGAAIAVNGGAPLIEDCTILGNRAGFLFSDGGGIWVGAGDPVMRSCLVAQNTAGRYGGGVYVGGGVLAVEASTITRNTAGSEGGGIYWTSPAPGSLTSTIVWGNCVTTLSFNIYLDGELSASCSDIESLGTVVNGQLTLDPQTTIDADPLFCDEATCGSTEPGDYRPRTDAPVAPAHAPAGCGLIGALPATCDPSAIQAATWGAIKNRYR
jgi:hypothetical protein